MRLFLLSVFLMSGWGVAQSSEPSLAELSKQVREHKAKAHKPARLITNADLKNFQDAPVSVSKTAEGPKPAQATTAAQVKALTPPEDAEYAKLLAEWKPKFQAAVVDYTNAATRGLVLQLRRKYLYNAGYYAESYIDRAGFAGEFALTEKEVASNEEELATAEKAIEALKIEARAAGVKEGDVAAMVGKLPRPSITD